MSLTQKEKIDEMRSNVLFIYNVIIGLLEFDVICSFACTVSMALIYYKFSVGALRVIPSEIDITRKKGYPAVKKIDDFSEHTGAIVTIVVKIIFFICFIGLIWLVPVIGNVIEKNQYIMIAFAVTSFYIICADIILIYQGISGLFVPSEYKTEPKKGQFKFGLWLENINIVMKLILFILCLRWTFMLMSNDNLSLLKGVNPEIIQNHYFMFNRRLLDETTMGHWQDIEMS